MLQTTNQYCHADHSDRWCQWCQWCQAPCLEPTSRGCFPAREQRCFDQWPVNPSEPWNSCFVFPGIPGIPMIIESFPRYLVAHEPTWLLNTAHVSLSLSEVHDFMLSISHTIRFFVDLPGKNHHAKRFVMVKPLVDYLRPDLVGNRWDLAVENGKRH